jgi:hypothetical protein
MCISLQLDKERFNKNVGSRYYLAIVGPQDNDVNACIRDYPQCGFFQPALLEAELPESLLDGLYYYSIVDMLLQNGEYPLTSSNRHYFIEILNVYPLSDAQVEKLRPYINPDNTMFVGKFDLEPKD